LPLEIIVVDDVSPDESAGVLATVDGLTLMRNAENLGFVGSCNAGAAKATGRWLVFLNNDTTVTAGWLEALIDTFADFDGAGLVGSRLVYPDGRLQEAGGLVFSDGSGWNYGRFENPADPRFSYARETDYCSGAAIAIERTLFERLGGFDARYAPAYYEDTDLAFKVREAGLSVICQPASTVIHHEGVTAGTDAGDPMRTSWRQTNARVCEE
jgi:GT2 family glycosyltransferase